MNADLWQSHLIFAFFAFLITPGFRLGPALQILRLLALLALSFVPLAGLSLADYVHSFTGDAAVTTLLALAYLTVVRVGFAPKLRNEARLQIVAVMAALALFLYPATMGLSYLDPYRLGFQPRLLISVIGVVALVLLALGNRLGACMLGLATLAFSLGIKSSTNYWDYLIDPFIAFYSCAAVVAYAVRVIRRKGVAGELQQPV
tara:strand:- start:766 stop:1374 length:609 start_codon:yes stop_codon:yes gene_type:complete